MNWTNKSAEELLEYLEGKIDEVGPEMYWISNTDKIYLTENGDLNEILMQGEFHEEIDMVREWIHNWKSKDFNNNKIQGCHRFILVDPNNKNIEEVFVNKATYSYKKLYELIGCTMFDAVQLTSKMDTMYVDDEGLYKQDKNKFFTIYDTKNGNVISHICGKGLITGTDKDGDTVSTDLSIETIKEMVKFEPDGFRYEPQFEFISMNN